MDPKIYMCYLIHCKYIKTQKEIVASWNRELPSPSDEYIFREMAAYMKIIRRAHRSTNMEYAWNNCGVKMVMDFMSKYIAFDIKI